jgi:hypothetical protein
MECSLVTILDCAVARGAKPDEDGSFTMGDIESVGLPFFGGCQVCHASIACFNAYPSKTNYLRCRNCIGELGFASTEEFETWCKQFDHDSPPEDDEDDGPCQHCDCDECICHIVLGDDHETEDIERAIDEGY